MTDHELSLFHFEEGLRSFEDYCQKNGSSFWYASDLAEMLGYESLQSLQNATNKAIAACTTLGIPVIENFIQSKREVNGRAINDYKLSRFACYLVAMNGDSKKPQVAAAQAYFAAMAETIRQHLQNTDSVERLLVRDEISGRERSLSGVAHAAGVTAYGLFQNAGYRGLYNMDLSRLRKHKGIDSTRSPLDFMGKEELAANLFRITQTEAKLKNDNVRGQYAAENTANQVGRKVRQTMLEISGHTPESLSPARDIKVVRQGLKKTQKEFAKIDANTQG